MKNLYSLLPKIRKTILLLGVSSIILNYGKLQAQTVGIGTSSFTPINMLDVKGNMVIGSTYSGLNSAPANGLLIQGYTGIGTTTVGYQLTLGGTGGVFGIENTANFLAKNSAGTYETYFWPRWSDNIMYINYGSAGFNVRNNSSVSTMFMNNGNQVGVNNTSPGAQLDVTGPATGTGITIRANGGGDLVLASGGSLFFDGNYSYAGGNYIRPIGGANTQGFFTSGSERMRIDANGYIGIGVSPSSSYRLNVSGNLNLTGAIYANGTPGANGQLLYSTAGGTNAWLAVGTSGQILISSGGIPGWNSLASIGGVTTSCGTTNYVPKMSGATTLSCSQIYDNGTNVGIATSSPGYPLDVYSAGGSWPAIFRGPQGYIQMGPANNGWAHIYTDRPNFIFNQNVWSIPGGFSSYSSADLFLMTNGTDRLHILNSNGNVGIGTTGPSYKLHVYDGGNGNWLGVIQNGSAISYFSHSSGYGAYIDAGSNASSGTYALDINKQGTAYLYVTGDGKTIISRSGTSECCSGGAYTLAITENTSVSGNKAGIQFHNSGYDEGQMQLTSGSTVIGGSSRRFKMFDNQGVTMGLEITGKLYYGNNQSRTESRTNAGLDAGGGAQSGFFENDGSTVTNYPAGASSWWHLIDCRHDNNANNYALQIAGSFFDQRLWFRKTNNNAAQPWTEILTTSNGVTSSCGTANYIPKMTTANSIGCSQIYDNGSNVGIGTTGPAYKLETDGDIYANGGWFRVSGTQGLYWESYGPGWYCSDGTWLRTYNNASIWANSGQIGTNGSFTCGYGGAAGPAGGAIFSGLVGVGTSTPSTSHMSASACQLLNVYAASSIGGDDMAEIVNGAANGLCTYIGNSSTSNAYNGSGGETNYTGTSYIPGGVFGLENQTSGTGMGVDAITNSLTSGSYGLYAQCPYANSAGYYAIYAAGRVLTTGNYYTTSDSILKKNITPLNNALNKILKLRPVEYDFNEKYSDFVSSSERQAGFIAQDVEKVFPGSPIVSPVMLVSKLSGKISAPATTKRLEAKAVSYTSFIPYMVEAIQEQQKMIEELKAKNTELENRIKTLENK
jgi:hypothetical protein